MAAMKIGALEFHSKGAAIEHFKAMLYRHPLGQAVPEPDATELSWLLGRHHDYEQKQGVGIACFMPHKTPVWGTVGFKIVRVDGSETDFSYRTCLDGQKTPLASVVGAMRQEVSEDIRRAKREWFAAHRDADYFVPCALTGRRVGWEEAHADHAPPFPFRTLAVAFIKARGIEPSWEMLQPAADNQYVPLLADRVLAEEWKAYHHELAVIRIVAKGANLSRSHESRVKKRDRQLQL